TDIPHTSLRAGRFHGVLAPNAKLRSKIVPATAERATESPSENAHGQGAPARISWARLLKRVFDVDVEHCPNCGGALKIIAVPSTCCYVDVKSRTHESSFFFCLFVFSDQRETCCYAWHGTRPSH